MSLYSAVGKGDWRGANFKAGENAVISNVVDDQTQRVKTIRILNLGKTKFKKANKKPEFNRFSNCKQESNKENITDITRMLGVLMSYLQLVQPILWRYEVIRRKHLSSRLRCGENKLACK